jgi:hypothetical protein
VLSFSTVAEEGSLEGLAPFPELKEVHSVIRAVATATTKKDEGFMIVRFYVKIKYPVAGADQSSLQK